VFPEERYYGESMPFGDDSFTPENAQYLTTEQVLEDYVELITHVKEKMNAQDCPVIAFGGSYGGTLTTFMRASYPNVIIGGLAASAPIGYYDKDGWEAHGVDEFTWSDIVTKVYDEADEQCMEYIHAAIDAVDRTPTSDLVPIFNVCEESTFSPKEPIVNSDLFIYALEGLPQQNYPYKVNALPAWPVNYTCGILVGSGAIDNDETLVKAAAEVTNLVLGSGLEEKDDQCMPTFPDGGVGRVPGDGPGVGNWGYQSCTETLHQFSSRGVRDYTFDMQTTALDLCQKYWGDNVYPDTHAFAKRFGGWKLGDGLTGVSNLIWSNGLLDPWSGGGFYKPLDESQSNNHYFVMPHGAHHLDLRAPNEADPDDVTDTRRQEEEIIVSWINDYVQARGA